MKFILYSMGKTDSGYLQQGIDDYTGRLRHFIDFSCIDLPNLKNLKNANPRIQCKREGEVLLRAVARSDLIVLLDERGKELSSMELADWLRSIMNLSYRSVAFLIGGAHGFSPEVYQRASYTLSLSRMTFTHQLARLFFLEQLYRAMTLVKRIPYHNE